MTAARTVIFFIVVGVVAAVPAVENYMDYGTNEVSNNDKPANLRDIYRILVQRSADETDGFRGLAAEHLQPRAAERSPSLRLRFGRSYSKYPRSPSLRLRFGRSYSNRVDQLHSRLNSDGSSDPVFELLSRLNGEGSSAPVFDEN